MSTISTHVLDTSAGRPAQGMTIRLSRLDDGVETVLSEGVTNADGRVLDLVPGGQIAPGRYRMWFDTGAWQEARGVLGFYPEVVVTFDVRAQAEHHHVPLLISPYGFSTYRGS